MTKDSETDFAEKDFSVVDINEDNFAMFEIGETDFAEKNFSVDDFAIVFEVGETEKDFSGVEINEEDFAKDLVKIGDKNVVEQGRETPENKEATE